MQLEVQLLAVTLSDASRLAGRTKSQIVSLIYRNIHWKLQRLFIVVHATLHIPPWSLVMSQCFIYVVNSQCVWSFGASDISILILPVIFLVNRMIKLTNIKLSSGNIISWKCPILKAKEQFQGFSLKIKKKYFYMYGIK